MSGQQLLLHGEAHPGPGLAHIRLDLADVLDVSVDTKRIEQVELRRELKNQDFIQ